MPETRDLDNFASKNAILIAAKQAKSLGQTHVCVLCLTSFQETRTECCGDETVFSIDQIFEYNRARGFKDL